MLQDDLKDRLQGTVLLVGVGNELRGDDGFGPRMIQLLAGKVKAPLLDVGEMPENHMSRILRQQAQSILVLDAANFHEAAGTATILEVEDMAGSSVSTHGMPLELFFNWVRNESQADVFALCVQPGNLSLGSGVSPEVERTTLVLSEIIIAVLNEAPQYTLGARSS